MIPTRMSNTPRHVRLSGCAALGHVH
jgi:hypothetical protein